MSALVSWAFARPAPAAVRVLFDHDARRRSAMHRFGQRQM
jgi:hypothetical protein